MLFRTATFAHIAAASLALLYAWQISTSAYVQTGLQFVAPLVVIMIVHLAWMAFERRLTLGFSQTVFRRSLYTAIGLICVIVMSNVITPSPAHAEAGSIVAGFGGIIFCLAIIAFVVGLAATVVYILFKIIAGIIKMVKNSDDGGNQTRLFDFGCIAVVGLVLGVASLEGIPSLYSFASSDHATASYHVDRSSERVWQTLETATSPDFPLAGLLDVFPKPVEVTIDEGMTIGATRKVKFTGREGTGYLTLVVTDRNETLATFTVKSDTSPIASWVAHRKLVYKVQPEGDGTRLNVTLEYDRRLAPAWFFMPLTKGAAYLAMDVLARDVKSRAEG